MATVISSIAVGDGYDVRIITGGETHTLHFLAEPSQVILDETILGIEQRLLNAIVESKGLDKEETDNGIFDR
jgi:hypothetical protein